MSFASIATTGYEVAGYANAAKSKKYNFDMLHTEIESAKLFVAQIKMMILKAKDQNYITSCSLPLLMDAVNAFQDFLKNNIQGKQNSLIWNTFTPESQRIELQSFINNIHMQFTVYQLEMQTYWNIVLDHMIQGTDLNTVQIQLQKLASECTRIHKTFQQTNTQQLDVCPSCTLMNLNRETINQKYLRTNKSQNVKK